MLAIRLVPESRLQAILVGNEALVAVRRVEEVLFLDHNFTGGGAGVGATTADATMDKIAGSALCIKSLSATWPNPPGAEDSGIPQDSQAGGRHHPNPAAHEDGKAARWRGFTDVSLDVDFGQVALVMGPVGAGTLELGLDFWTFLTFPAYTMCIVLSSMPMIIACWSVIVTRWYGRFTASGKTTMLMAILGELEMTEGSRISTGGAPVWQLRHCFGPFLTHLSRHLSTIHRPILEAFSWLSQYQRQTAPHASWMRPTWCLCLSDADWGLQSDGMPDSRGSGDVHPTDRVGLPRNDPRKHHLPVSGQDSTRFPLPSCVELTRPPRPPN